MNHLFLFIPTSTLDWLLLIASFGVIVILYLGRPQQKDTITVPDTKQIWKIIFLVLLPLLGLLGEFLFFKGETYQSPVYTLQIIPRLIVTGFPIIFAATFLPYHKGFRWVFGWGLLYALVITHSGFTVLEFSVLYFIFARISPGYSRKDLRGFFIQNVTLLLKTTPYLFIITFLQCPGSIAVRLDATFTIGWHKILAYIVSLVLANAILWVFLNFHGHHSNERIQRENSGENHINDYFSVTLVIYFVVVLFLGSSSAYWLFQRDNFLKKIDEATSEIIPTFAEDYYYFFDIGKALAQSHSEEYSLISEQEYTSKLIEQINQIPFFSSMMILKNGILKASYPESTNFSLDDFVFCEELMKTGTMVSMQHEDTTTNFVFSSGTTDGICLVGVTTLEFSPQFDHYIQLMDQFSTYWSVADQSGTIYSSGEKDWEGTPEYYLSGSYKETTITNGPMILSFVQVFELEEIAKVVADRSKFALPILLVFYLVVMLVLLWVNRDIHKKVSDTMMGLSYLQNFEFGKLINREPEGAWFGVNFQLRKIALSIQSQISYLQKGLEVVDKVNEVLTYQELQKIINGEEFLQEIGRLTLLLDPNIEITGIQKGDGQYNTQYNVFAKKAQKESYKPFILQTRNEMTGEMENSSTLFPLEHEGRLLGFLAVSKYANPTLYRHQQRFLESLSNMIAGTIFHRLQRTQVSIENERINFLVRAFPDPIIVFDKDQKLIEINDAAKKLPGIIGEQALTGFSIRRFIRDKTLLDILTAIDRAGSMGSWVQLSNRREYRVNIVSNDDVSSEDGWSLVVFQDITQFREQGQMRAELFETVAQYLQMPIKMTRGNLRMLAMVGTLNESQRIYADNMETNIDDIDSFVKQMMERNRLENPANYNMQIIDLDSLLKEAVDRIVPYTQQQNVAIYLERDGDPQTRQIEIDPQLFSQAIFSLLENAVQNNHVGGEVNITIEDHADHFIICIADNGPGISAVDLNRIFVDPSVLELHGESPRISMGVQLAKSIIERHNGEIWVKSKLGKGSQFFVKIPRYIPAKQRMGSY